MSWYALYRRAEQHVWHDLVAATTARIRQYIAHTIE